MEVQLRLPAFLLLLAYMLLLAILAHAVMTVMAVMAHAVHAFMHAVIVFASNLMDFRI
jgi:hypothetical protein|uniref:Uncharacterized protein n=1 Tax=Picea glauca TaxID=3330 RepID=A0A117NHI5_PICGL|nr:hypothetical protein ABT39_MTgene5380 [Picea glauca]QHR86401.1 hypothetical protein Q903MT_gene400 [Picea sitchensis]